MPLERQVITMPLAQGVDTKTDDKQVVAGKLLELENGVFTRLKAIRKRNGYAALGQTISNASQAVAPVYAPARLLLLGDGSFADTSVVGATMVVGDGASIATGPTGLPNVTTIMQFDGTVDGYVRTPNDAANYPQGTGNFTFEAYVYLTSPLTTDMYLFDTNTLIGDDGCWCLIHPDGLPAFGDYSTVVIDCLTNPLTIDGWNYIVVQRTTDPLTGDSVVVIGVKPAASSTVALSGSAIVSPATEYTSDIITIGNSAILNVHDPIIISNFRYTRAALYPTFPFTPPAPPLSPGV